MPPKLTLTPNRLITNNTELWDGDAYDGPTTPLPASDEDVRRDINRLLILHHQRDLPPERPKAASKKKEATK